MVQVLVVDDDPPTREVPREVLEQAGYEVREASDGDVALDMLRGGPAPVVALLDLDMPGTNGLEVLQASAEESHALGRHRYILMTAVAQSRVQQAAGILSPLSVPVVNKPFDVDDLLSLVEQCAASLPVTP